MPKLSHVVAVAGALALAGCTAANRGLSKALIDEGATPGTIPLDRTRPDGTFINGLTPEPWGSTAAADRDGKLRRSALALRL
jgi:hypothetical protein